MFELQHASNIVCVVDSIECILADPPLRKVGLMVLWPESMVLVGDLETIATHT